MYQKKQLIRSQYYFIFFVIIDSFLNKNKSQNFDHT